MMPSIEADQLVLETDNFLRRLGLHQLLGILLSVSSNTVVVSRWPMSSA